jgi:nicotinamide phosphoribosyltransferase
MRRNIIINLILNTDSYKINQYRQYPPNTTNIFSYVEARGANAEIQALYDEFLPGEDVMVTYVGPQIFIKEYLSVAITHADIDEAKPILKGHGFDFNEADWRIIVDEFNGFLPLHIMSVREGSVVPVSNVLSNIRATDPRFYWLVSYVETAWMRASWYPVTVASNDYLTRRIITNFMEKTADYESSEIDFMMHCFGARGVSSMESAGIGTVAHGVYFKGTDTLSGVPYIMQYYNETDVTMFSINASEHSTMTSWGKECEDDAFRNMLTQFGKDNTIVAVVSDSYGIEHGVNNWRKLKHEVIEFGSRGGRLVVRPDSGDPVATPVWVVEELMDIYGYETNSKGYRVLPNFIRVIQGDGIDLTSMGSILSLLERHGLSASNIAFGRGAGTLQLVNRDQYGFAMKASAREAGNMWHDVWKEAPGKASKRGRVTLVRNQVTKAYRTIDFHDAINYHEVNQMHTVYHNGVVDDGGENWINVRNLARKEFDRLAGVS